MSLRILGFILAAVVLVGYRVIKPRTQASDLPGHWNLSTLLLASALTLFAELALIRWVATEVRVFAYVKNLALLLCFLGFGIGCALARQRPRWQTAATALLGLIVIVRLPWRGPQIMESLSQYLGAAQDVEIWATGTMHDTTGFLLAVAVTIILLLLITYIFIPIGQTVSRQIELAPRTLYGYSWNLAGSLAGILRRPRIRHPGFLRRLVVRLRIPLCRLPRRSPRRQHARSRRRWPPGKPVADRRNESAPASGRSLVFPRCPGLPRTPIAPVRRLNPTR